MKKDSLKLLTIGNSFSDDSMKYVYDIAVRVGIEKPVLGNLYIPGCSLDRHFKNAEGDLPEYEYRTNTNGEWITTPETKLSTALAAEDWEIISMQQQSGNSGMPDSYGHLGDLIKYVRSFCPNATLVWNMTWAFPGDSTHRDFVKYDSDQQKMYSAIVNTVKKVIIPSGEFSLVIPTGTAIQNARTSYLGDTLNRDGLHLSYRTGRFTAGLTFVRALTGRDIEGIDFRPEDVDEKAAQTVKRAATNAVINPFEVTPF